MDNPAEEHAPPSRRQAHAMRLVIGLELAALILGGAAWTWHDYAVSLRHARQEARAAAVLVEEHALRSLAAVDGALWQVVELVREVGVAGMSTELAGRRLASLARPLPSSGAIFVYDPSGNAIASSLAVPTAGIPNVADREYFRELMSGRADYQIGRVLRGRSVHKFFFPVARAVTNEHGGVAAVIQVGVPVDYIAKLFGGTHRDSGGGAGLYRAADGLVVARYPTDETLLDESVAGMPFYGPLTGSAAPATWLGQIATGTGEYLVAARRVAGFPLIVTTTVPAERVLAGFRQRLLWRSAAVSCVAALLLALARMWEQAERRVAEAEAAVRRREQLNHQTLQALPVHIAVVDRQGGVRAVNGAWEKFAAHQGTRISPGANYLETWQRVTSAGGPEAASVGAGIEAVLAGRQTQFTQELACPWGAQPRWFVLTVSPFGSDAEPEGGALITHLDITERKRAEAAVVESARLRDRTAVLAGQNAVIEQSRRALEEKAAELALTSRYKSEFLANMSHELRTPLNSILIFSQLLAENEEANLTARQVEFSSHIHSSGTDLLQLIDDILDLTKIESGTVSVKVEPIAFCTLRETIERTFRHVAEAKELPVHVEFAQGLPHAIESDSRRLRQILRNLISNALKFTAHGHVRIRVELATEGWNADHPILGKAAQVVAFAVEDTGIGIAPDKQRLIFESFQQADPGTSLRYGGTGLGLAISRELAALLGGEIQLASLPGHGSTFTLYLPLSYAGGGMRIAPAGSSPVVRENPGKGGKPLEADREALRGRTVLVVDDDAHNAFALLSLLENEGIEVLTAATGRRAIELIESTPQLSFVLMDLRIDGMETLRKIRQTPEFRSLPILVLAANVMRGQREQCLEAGASDYMARPVESAQLFSRMRGWLS